MTTITGTVSGYTIMSPATTLSITTTGYVNGPGVRGESTGSYTVVSDGRIAGTGNGVSLDGADCSVTNGSVAHTTASIYGYTHGVALYGANGAVANFGVITEGLDGHFTNAVISLVSGGSVTNGSSGDTHALIEGSRAVDIGIDSGAGTVTNFGSIIATGYGISSFGALLREGGRVTNGAAIDTTALISGGQGVFLDETGTVINFATIVGTSDYGVALDVGGAFTNGSPTDRAAVVEGYQSGVGFGGSGTVANFGVIREAAAVGGDYGVYLTGGGALTNGAVNDPTALISGYGGVQLEGAGASANFGVIEGLGGATRGYGAYVSGGASLTNGAANATGAMIEGYGGVKIDGASTVTNFATISGAGGVAVELASDLATLIVEAGSTFTGQVLGGGGMLELGPGTGAVSGLGGNVTVSGDMAATTFQNFGTVEVGPGAVFTLSGNASLAAGQVLIDAGSLSVAGTLASAGAVTVSGTLAGAGTLALTGGAATLNAGTALTIASVTVSGSATKVGVNAPLAYAGKWTQSAGTLTVAGGDTMTFTGTADSFAGTLAGAGTVALASGTDTLAGTALAAAGVTMTSATVTLAGTIAISHQVTAGDPSLIVAAGGATLSGGTFNLTGSAANAIIGATATATLTVKDTLLGAGQLGDGRMILVNDGVIAGDDPVALTVNTGAHTIVNAGTIEATRAGGLATIASAVDNTGVLAAVSGGVLTVDGAVTGSGIGEVGTGTLKFAAASTFNENVTFTSGSTGTLELAHGQTYTGTITGFSTTAANALDLDDIPFVSGTTTATFAGTASGGVLTVKNGGAVASIKLTGDYLGSSFVTSLGAGGVGTRIVDPAASPAAGSGPTRPRNPILPAHTFIQSMAGMEAEGSATPVTSHGIIDKGHTLLAAPRLSAV